MATLLHLDSSPLETSVSRQLGREFVTAWQATHADGDVVYRDLAVSAPKPLDAGWIYAAFTPESARTEEQKGALNLSDELIGELFGADEIVIGVAMHNFSIPAVLKLWIDQIARKGKTFDYGATGPKGLLPNQKTTLLVASGGVYEPGTPMGALNFVDPYLKSVLGFMGLTNVNVVLAGGTAALMSGTVDREKFLEPSLEQVRSVAA